jgi:hypothetical protein
VGQHGIELTERRGDKLSFLTFDNQASFIFDGEGTVDNGARLAAEGNLENDRSTDPYSQIIEYEIDEAEMTVRQRWQFGQGMTELYGGFASGTGVLKTTGNRLLVSNGADQRRMAANPYNPHVLEITEEGAVVFHLEIENTGFSAHRAGRIDLYHPERAIRRVGSR